MPVVPWRQWIETGFTFAQCMSAKPSRASDRAQRLAVFNQRLASAVSSWIANHGLIHNSRSDIEHNVSDWLRFGAWAQCEACSVWYPRALSQKDCDESTWSRRHLRKKCWHCAKHGSRRDNVPKVDDAPSVLCNLPRCANFTLRPLVLHQGTPKRHAAGYMRKDRATTVSWKAKCVADCIAEIESPSERQRIQDAFTWLRKNNKCYSAYLLAHEEAIAADSLNLPPSAILEPYLECALWPLLYWLPRHAESDIFGAKWQTPFKKQALSQSGKASAKELFLCKICSGIAEFSCNFELLQFQFDRHILRTVIGGANAMSDDADRSLSVSHRSWSADYWKKHHRLLMDISMQHGEPDLFLTIAPYEWSFPFPYWVEKLHSCIKGGPTDAPAAETIAIAHALHQIVAGLLCGKTADRWVRHMLCDKLGKQETVKCYFARFEFQDGGSEHCYGKGRGSLHLHMLIWLQNIRSVLLEREIRSEFVEGDAEVSALSGLVQTSMDGHTRTTQQSENSYWNFDETRKRWKLNLRCPADYLAAKLRPFFTSILWLLRCHQDVQWCNENGLVLRYVAGYVSKFFEGWSDTWMNEASSSLQAGLAVLRCWHASQPQMAMVLSRASMAFTSVITSSYRPLCYWEMEDEKLHLYRRRDRELSETSFLEWLRLMTFDKMADGKLFAKRRKKKGLVALAVQYDNLSRDQFFWQWLVMNVPHRMFTDLIHPDSRKVSPCHQHFANAILMCPEKWGAEQWIQSWLLKQGHRVDYIQTTKSDFQCRRSLVQEQIAGRIPKYSAAAIRQSDNYTLTPKQQAAMTKVTTALQLRSEQTGEMVRRCLPFFITGGPGTGKSVTCRAIIQHCVDEGLRVLVASPTGRLACDAKYPNSVVSTTFHRAFGVTGEGLSDDFDYVASFDVWIVNEVGMMDVHHTDHILKAWHCLGKWPLLVFEGDFQQLPPPCRHYGDPRASVAWHVKTIQLVEQKRCDDDTLLQFQQRARSSPLQQHEIDGFLSELTVAEEIHEESLSVAWEQLPQAIVLTGTVKLAAEINEFAQRKFAGEKLATISIWVGNTIQPLDLHQNAKIMITRNGDLEAGMCHGAAGTVLQACRTRIIVQLSDRITSLHLRSAWIDCEDRKKRLQSAFDVGLAYAFTVHKVQGATLSAVILCFESWCCKAWGYTAITRVRQRDSLRILGKATARHFEPR